jgi:hypothetical protein
LAGAKQNKEKHIDKNAPDHTFFEFIIVIDIQFFNTNSRGACDCTGGK